MKIGFLSKEIDFTEGGGATFKSTILNKLERINSKHEFYVFHYGKSIPSTSKNIKFVSIDSPISEKNPIKRFILKKQWKNNIKKSLKNNSTLLNKVVNENKIDLMWFLSPEFEEVKIPYVMTVWDLQHRLQPYFPEVSISGWKWEERENFWSKVLPNASIIITGNEVGKKQIKDLYAINDDRIKIIPLPVSDFIFDEFNDVDIENKFGIKENYIFYPAQFWPHKNHIRLLKALKILNDKGLNFSLVLTGSDKGNLRYIKQKVKELDLEEKVYFLGFVSTEDIVNLYKKAFALVFPSFFGPDNIPPLEAMALDCPVLCSNADGMKEQLGDCAIYFDLDDENQIVEQLENLYNNPDKRNFLIQKGKNLAEKRRSNNYIEIMIKIINDFEHIKECWDHSSIDNFS